MDKLQEYVFRIENENFSLEYIYLANNSYSDKQITHSDIKVRLLKLPNPLVTSLPFTLLWETCYDNQELRRCPYYPFQFGLITDEHVFVALENRLVKISISSGSIMFEKVIGNTSITDIGFYQHQILVLSEGLNFDLAKHSNNLRMVDDNGDTIWIAELATEGPHYKSYDAFRITDDKIEAWSGSLFIVLDNTTGKKLSSRFVK